jgi:DNA modification methylase
MSKSSNGNILYYGENLDILRKYIKSETVDLIYLDPPFNSNRDYNVLFEEKNGTDSASQIKVFGDTWKWDVESAGLFHDTVQTGGHVADALQGFQKILGNNDMLAYLSMMAPRLKELYRVLKHTGTIYLHCDPTASHYIKILMDAVFGPEHFVSEIIWRRKFQSATIASNQRSFGNNHDSILFYVKSDEYTLNPVISEREVDLTDYPHDADGYYKSAPADGEGQYSKDTLKRMLKAGEAYKTRTGRIRKRIGLKEVNGKLIDAIRVDNMWTDLPNMMHVPKDERLGYPTQKPKALLGRIIEASSSEGDLVLDPFCGCGTTIEAAQYLKRRWIGIDVTYLAIALMKHRLDSKFQNRVHYTVVGEPVSLPDAVQLANDDKYQFQWWALSLVHARPVEPKKGADRGIDGVLKFFLDSRSTEIYEIIFSVKGGHVTVSQVRDLVGVVNREKAAIGAFITLEEQTTDMRTEAASAGFFTFRELVDKKYPKIQIRTVAQLLEGKLFDFPPFALREGNATFKAFAKPQLTKKHPTKLLTDTILG